MNKNLYAKIYKKYHNTAFSIFCKRLNQLITGLTFVLYPVLILFLLYRKDPMVISFVIVPAIAFVVVSVFRKFVNRKRPYEKWQIPPLIPRDKKGHSFPSRHVFSIFLIASLWAMVDIRLGSFLFVCSVILAILRVFCGIHYFSDVLAGAILGILSAYLSIFVCFI